MDSKYLHCNIADIPHVFVIGIYIHHIGIPGAQRVKSVVDDQLIEQVYYLRVKIDSHLSREQHIDF